MAHPIEFLEDRIAPAAVIAATSNNELLSFDSEAPGTVETISITGFAGTTGETLVGIDFRPATGVLYGFTVNDASQGQLYRINPITGEAIAVGTAVTDANLTLSKTAGYGFDFNPAVDRIRIVNSDGENFRLNPNNGALAGVDTDLTASAVVHGSAYDRSFAGTTGTTLFGIDINTDQLVLQGSVNGTPNSPNGGAITNVGALGVDASAASFDIANGTGTGFAALQVGSSTGLYTVNLSTGAVTFVDDIGTGTSTIVGIAVATEQIEIVNSSTARFNDVDGDVITIKITKGELTLELFELGAGPNGGAYLRGLNLTNPSFAGTNLTITAKPGPDGGDKLVSVGYINATGNDLGTVKISGDLTQIDAGDTGGGEGVKSLSIYSFGVINPLTSATDGTSSIEGSLGKFTVTRDFAGGTLQVIDSTEDALGRLSSVVIGGSFIGGSNVNSGNLFAESIGTVKISGNLEGGSGNSSGQISSSGDIDAVSIGGSFIGGSSEDAGVISSGAGIGKITIKQSLVGGSGLGSGYIEANGDVGSILIGGSLSGGSNEDSGYIDLNEGSVGSITVKGAIIGGSGSTAYIRAGDISKLTVGKSLIGSSSNTATITAGALGTVKIGGDLLGGGFSSARIVADSINNLTINGSMIGTNEDSASVIVGTSIGKASVGGNIVGSSFNGGIIEAESAGTISIAGSIVGSGSDSASIILSATADKISVGGDLTGSGDDTGVIRVGTTAGSISIGGSIIGSNEDSGRVFVGTTLEKITVGGDVMGEGSGSGVIFSGNLESVTIRGSVAGGVIRADNIITKLTIGGDVSSFSEDAISAEGTIESVTIEGSVQGTGITGMNISNLRIGGDVQNSVIRAETGLGNITIEGSLRDSTLDSDATINKVTIGGDVYGSGLSSGAILADAWIGSVKIGGSIVSGDDGANIVGSAIGPVSVSGDMVGITIAGLGILEKLFAIESVTVSGRVQDTNILAGYDSSFAPVNPDAPVGKVSVGGDWTRSNLVAGIASSNAVFGDSDDVIIPSIDDDENIVASIASITIKGSVIGTFGGTDGFAFTAEEIKSATVSGTKIKLQSGQSNDNLLAPGATQDVRIREVFPEL